MTEAVKSATADWTCARCEMTVSWMPDTERPTLPATWIKEHGELYCLACRRDRAAEAGLEGMAENASAEKRQQAQSRARVEFELMRKPDRQDNRVAKSCHTSIIAVRKARVRLGLQSQRPA
jgi:hypothetical protein